MGRPSVAHRKGSVFSGWSGACTRTSRSCTIKMNRSRKVVATLTYEYCFACDELKIHLGHLRVP